MPDEDLQSVTPSQSLERALARWENEGGTSCSGHGGNAILDEELSEASPSTNTELSLLHIRVIALEGLVTALLVEASDRQINLAREMAAYISPRLGSTQHPLTIRAATQMIDLLERADNFRVVSAENN